MDDAAEDEREVGQSASVGVARQRGGLAVRRKGANPMRGRNGRGKRDASEEPTAKAEEYLLRDQAVERIRELIFSGSNGFLMGEPLSENIIEKRFPGLTKTPIRQALSKLREDGLVETLPRSGTRVRLVRREEVRAIMGARFSLETVNACELVFNPPESLAPLEAVQEAMVRTLQEARDQVHDRSVIPTSLVARFVEEDINFHVVMSELARAMPVAEFLRRAGGQFLLYVLQQGLPVEPHLQVAVLEEVVKDHEKILKAIKKRDPEEARSAIRNHLRSAVKRWYPDASRYVDASARYADESQTLKLGDHPLKSSVEGPQVRKKA